MASNSRLCTSHRTHLQRPGALSDVIGGVAALVAAVRRPGLSGSHRRDINGAMLDKIEPPRLHAWRSSADQTTDSGSDSHPLLSSDASRRSFGATCMFPDSETSDFEATSPSNANREPSLPAPRSPHSLQLANARRPFNFRNHQDQLADATYNRFHYYNKLRSMTPYEDSTLMIPDHMMPMPLFIPYIPGQEQDVCKQSSLVTIFAVWNTIMGSSLLTMPWGIERAGFFTGVVLMLLMGGICLYTTYRLLDINRLHGASKVDGEVSDLCRMLLGRSAEIIAKFFSLIVLLGANIVYWILMSNFLFHSVQFIYDRTEKLPASSGDIHDNISLSVLCPKELKNISEEEDIHENGSSFYDIWNLHLTVPLFLVLIIAPLVNFKSASFFTKFNSLGTLSVIYLLTFVLIKAIGWGINIDFVNLESPFYVPQFLPSFPALSGMLALSFFIHNIIITIMRNNRYQENNGRDLSIAYVLVTFTYLVIGTVFYVCFPLKKTCIDDNFLNNFHNSDVMTVAARMFLFFQLVTVFPLIAYMLRVQVLAIVTRNPHPGLLSILSFNSIVVLICVLFAIFLPKIGTIIRFTGALSGFIYIFTLPSLLHLASLRLRGKLTWFSIIIHVLIPLFGGGNLLAQFFVVDH